MLLSTGTAASGVSGSVSVLSGSQEDGLVGGPPPRPRSRAEPPPLSRDEQKVLNSAKRVIVKTARMSAIVDDVDKAVASAEEEAEKLGGFSTAKSLKSGRMRSAEDERPRSQHCSITFRVPAAQLPSLLATIRKTAKWVESENEDTEDSTNSFFDLRGRIHIKEIMLGRLEKMLEKASDENAMMRLFQRMSQYMENLEGLKGQMQRLKDRALLSTLHLTLRLPPSIPIPIPPNFWSPFNTAAKAMGVLLRYFRLMADGAIWVAVLGTPVVAAIALLVWLGCRGGRAASAAPAARTE